MNKVHPFLCVLVLNTTQCRRIRPVQSTHQSQNRIVIASCLFLATPYRTVPCRVVSCSHLCSGSQYVMQQNAKEFFFFLFCCLMFYYVLQVVVALGFYATRKRRRRSMKEGHSAQRFTARSLCGALASCTQSSRERWTMRVLLLTHPSSTPPTQLLLH
jgi:hypothetical protein